MLKDELERAMSLALTVGLEIMAYYATEFVAEEKIGADDRVEPVTEADRRASKIIVDALAKDFPLDAVLSEEEPDDTARRLASKRVWIIDPLDGTAGFVKRDGDFSVQIGLAETGVPVVGVVYMPFHRSLMYAAKGTGAFLVRGDEAPQRLTASSTADLARLTLAMSRNHPSSRMGKIIDAFGFEKIHNRGSVGLKVGLIANRTCDIYIHPSPRTKLWDTCAPQIILEEAGGRFTDLFGESFKYDRRDLQNRNGILATNGTAHDAAIERLKPLLDEFGRVPHQY
ncbi:MAG: 3'(2'),5'-bisphosphate nucleotidase CysQ [Chloracidobacterium sp.]|nr:3'(2'),5'-bisphosphate nucleotidase CysQ [Chloracidobacterium sp.]